MSYYKRFLIFALSALLIFAQPVAYAASPVGWSASPADVIINGATATINAVKGSGSSALQSTIKHAPAAGRVAKHIVKVGGVGAVAMAITQTLGDGVDWVLDPANNQVKYYDYGDGAYNVNGFSGNSVSDAVATYCAFYISNKTYSYCKYHSTYQTRPQSNGLIYYDVYFEYNRPSDYDQSKHTKSQLIAAINTKQNKVEKTLPIDTVAAQVISSAGAGNAPSQELVKTVAIEDLESGALDVPLNINAVPVADAPPVNPPYDPTEPVPPFDPSSIISAVKSVMGAVVNMSGVLGAKIDALMIDLGLKQAETVEAITAGTGEIVAANDRTGAKVAEMVAAIEAIEGNTMDGQLINDAIDRVIANDDVKVGDIVAAIEAIEGNTMDGQLINDAIDRVIANDNANAQAAADAANTAADAAKATDAANTAAVTDAIDAAAVEAKEAADAKAAADAAALEWAKEAPEAPTDTGVVVDEPISDFDSDKSYITFTGSCPPKYTASLSIMGATAPFEFDYTPICTVMSYLKPFIVGAGYIAAAYIIAGHSRGSKD